MFKVIFYLSWFVFLSCKTPGITSKTADQESGQWDKEMEFPVIDTEYYQWYEKITFDMNTHKRLNQLSELNVATNSFDKCSNGMFAVLVRDKITISGEDLEFEEFMVYLFKDSEKRLLTKFSVAEFGNIAFSKNCRYLATEKWIYSIEDQSTKNIVVPNGLYLGRVMFQQSSLKALLWDSERVDGDQYSLTIQFGTVDLKTGEIILKNKVQFLSKVLEKPIAYPLLEKRSWLLARFDQNRKTVNIERVSGDQLSVIRTHTVKTDGSIYGGILNHEYYYYTFMNNDTSYTTVVHRIDQENPVGKFQGSKAALYQDRYLALDVKHGTDHTMLRIYDLKSNSVRLLTSNKYIGVAQKILSYENGIIVKMGFATSAPLFLEYDLDGNEQPIFSTSDFGRDILVNQVEIESSEQFKYPAYVFQNINKKQKGMIVYVHGGGCHTSTKFYVGAPKADFYDLVKAGYTIIAISYRNDTFPEHVPQSWNSEICGTVELDDIEAGYRYARSMHSSIPVFLWGFSQGGYLVNMWLKEHDQKGLWNGVISESGVWDSYFMDKDWTKYYDRSRDPIHFSTPFKTPLLIFHGERDEAIYYSSHKKLMHKYLNLLFPQLVQNEQREYEYYKVNSMYDYYIKKEIERFPDDMQTYFSENRINDYDGNFYVYNVNEEHQIKESKHYGSWMKMFLNFLDKYQ